MWAFWLLGLIGFEVLADIFVKEHSLKKSYWTFIIALIGYVLANTCWLISMRYRSHLGLSANIFSVSTGVLAVSIGCIFYGEVLSTQQVIGVILGILSLVLLIN